MKSIISVLIVLTALALPLCAQLDTPRVAPEVDLRDLSERATASQFVITGTVLTTKGIGMRVPPNDLTALKTAVDKGPMGFLFTIKADDILCRQSDFRTDTDSPKPSLQPGSILHVFVSSDAAPFSGEYRAEYLLQGERYLLFLVPSDPKDQERWTSKLTLDPTQTYFRALQYSRGTILLPQFAGDHPVSHRPPVLENIAQLCAAVRHSTIAEKLAALRQLANSADPVLSKEAEITIKSLESHKGTP